MTITTSTICTDPSKFASLANNHRGAITAFNRILLPLVNHSASNGIISIPQKLSISKEDDQDDVIAFTYELFRLSPILEFALEGQIGPFAYELQDLSSYDLIVTPALAEIRDKPRIGRAFASGEIEALNKKERAKQPTNPKPKREAEKRSYDLATADIRAFRKAKGTVTLTELIERPEASAIPALLMTDPSYTLSLLTADGVGLKSDNLDERIGALNLIAKIVETYFTHIKSATEIDEKFKRGLLTFKAVREALKEVKNDSHMRLKLDATLLDSITEKVLDESLGIFLQLN